MITANRPPEGLSAEQAELQAVLASRTFARAPLLSRMLAYVCEQSFEGNSESLKEYSIGAIALGRGQDFDPETDSIVRVMATRLRKRLIEYYAREGAGHHVKIFLSEVGYAPVFSVGTAMETAAVAAPDPEPDGSPDGRPLARRIAPYLAVGAACAMLGGIAVWMALRPGRQASGISPAEPNVRAIWSEVLKADQPTDIVLADSALALVQELTGKPTSLTDYISKQYLMLPEVAADDPQRHDQLTLTITRRFTSMSDVHISNQVLAMAHGTRAQVAVVFARDYSVAQMQSDNVILAGSESSNPWVATFNNILNFRLERGGIVRNLAPKTGEPAVYTKDPGGDKVAQAYAVAAFLPKNGGSRSVLIAAGTESQGTLAAANFLAGEGQLKAFRSRLPYQPSGRFPHFEALLRVNKWSGAAEVLAFRAIP